MNLYSRTQLSCLLTLLLLTLVGCERTVFQSPPTLNGGCDAQLAGHWVSLGDKQSEEGEVEALVGPDCRLVTVERRSDGERRSQATTFSTAQIDGVNYLWLAAPWSHLAFDVDETVLDEPSDVYLMSYKFKRETLHLSAPRHRELAHKVLDSKIRGELVMHDDNLVIRIEGEPDAIRQQLRKHRMFEFKRELRFKRATDSSDSP
jgi:hypothetical protein